MSVTSSVPSRFWMWFISFVWSVVSMFAQSENPFLYFQF